MSSWSWIPVDQTVGYEKFRSLWNTKAQSLQQAVNEKQRKYVIDPRDFGCAFNGARDDAPGFAKAIAEANRTSGGAIVRCPASGTMLWGSDTEVVVKNSGVFLDFLGGFGKTFATSTHQGTRIKLAANQSAAMIRFAVDDDGNNLAGCGVRGLNIEGAARGFTVANAALHLESADNFVAEHVVLYNVAGRGVRVTRTVLSWFSDFYVKSCGDTSLPAIDMDPTASGGVQGTTFTGFKVETCQNATYCNVNAKVFSCKFDNWGFECDPNTAATLQTFLNDQGTRNQWGKAHFNRTDASSTLPKATFAGVRCQYASLVFAGAKSDSASAGDFVVSGNRNQFGMVEIDGVALTPSVATTLSFLVSGSFNTITQVTGAAEGCFTLSGADNTVMHYQADAPGGTVTLSGANCELCSAMISSSTVNGSPVITLSGSRSRAKARIVTAANASEAVLLSGISRIMPGSFISGITNGHGVHCTVSQSRCDGVDMDTIGKHGVFVDACEPRSVSGNYIRACSGSSAGTYNGISFESTTNKNTGGVCNDNRIEQGANTHAFSIFVTDNAGTPRYGNWTFVGNNYASGGTFSVSTGTNIIANNRS